MGAPKANTKLGMMSSPPATPSRLLTRPMPRPSAKAATGHSASGTRAAVAVGRNDSTMSAPPMATSSTRMTASRRSFDRRAARAGPSQAVMRAPAVIATMAAPSGASASRLSVLARVASETISVTSETARLSGTACRAA